MLLSGSIFSRAICLKKTVKISAFCKVTTSWQSVTYTIGNYLQLTMIRLRTACFTFNIVQQSLSVRYLRAQTMGGLDLVGGDYKEKIIYQRNRLTLLHKKSLLFYSR